MNSDVVHVCFDKDGTLIDVHASWVPITRRRAQKVLQAYHLPEEKFAEACRVMGVDADRKRIIPGGPVGYKPRTAILEALEIWLKGLQVKTNLDELAQVFRTVDADIQASAEFNARALTGVVESVKRLSAAGLKLSIYTSDRHKNTEMVMRRLGLEQELSVIVGGDDVQKPKPDPEGFQTACRLAGVDIRHSVYVGDTADDMFMAKQAKACAVYGVAQGLSTPAELKIYADHVFETLTDLTDHLLNHR